MSCIECACLVFLAPSCIASIAWAAPLHAKTNKFRSLERMGIKTIYHNIIQIHMGVLRD